MAGATVRLVDVICNDCQHDIMKQGWGQRFLPLIERDFSQCDRCAETVDATCQRFGTSELVLAKPLPFLTEDERREYIAVHEAAHAVVGEHLGMVVESVVVEKHESVAAGRVIPAAGVTEWAIDSLRASTLGDYAAMTVAGMQANQRWLASRGQDTHPNRLEVAAGGNGDILSLEHAVDGRFPMRQVMKEARASADTVISGQWDQITAVARAVLANGRMDRDQVRDVMHTAGHQGRISKPVPRNESATDSTRHTPNPSKHATTTGGTSMAGIEEIIAAISNTSSKSEQIQGALAQVQQWATEIAGHLHMALGESGQHEVQQVIGLFQELAEQRITELHQPAALRGQECGS
ncbi:hypothetical protein [Saccharopolyspora sp. ASAGF58]|uniref:hypothetical protein n=1 Tax=Saccharopolyspora sp. ASAGF58 TaxID=2719023 RepID=UPI00143FE1FC|nr:hypothetical protein [Saccharopolyspora sp. ASAGF58]QIZ36126.1 hypothetical protein FDZ84_17385 [Saccharopolyspora sp. ASAGF58]